MKIPAKLTKKKHDDEKFIERESTKYAATLGFLGFKWKNPHNTGVPDHIYFKRFKFISVCVVVEYKSKGEPLTKLQEKRLKELYAFGAITLATDNLATSKIFFDKLNLDCFYAERIENTSLSKNFRTIYKVY